MLKRSEVLKRLGIGKAKYLVLVRTGELEAIRTGDAPNSPYRVSEVSVAAFIERRKVRPEPADADAS